MGLGGDNNVMFSEETKEKHDVKMRTAEVRNKISESMKKLRKEKGFSQETRQKISEKLKGNTHFAGKKRTQEAINKTVQALFKKVECSNGLSFNSVKEASIWWQQNGNSLKYLRSIASDIKKSNDNNIAIKGLIWKYN